MTIDAFGSWRHSSHKSRNRSPGFFFLYFTLFKLKEVGGWGQEVSAHASSAGTPAPCLASA